MAVPGAFRAAAIGATWLLVAACSGPAAPAPAPVTTPTAEPPAPPAACLLDVSALGTDTGLRWAVDEAMASDNRCVYDPVGAADDVFLVVDVAEGGADIDTVAQVCTDGSVEPAGTGFGCRLATGGVFAARTVGDRLVTAAAAQLPAGTTPEQLDAALTGQLD